MHMEQRLATFENCLLSIRRVIYPIDFLSAGNRQIFQVRILWSAQKSNGTRHLTLTADCVDKRTTTSCHIRAAGRTAAQTPGTPKYCTGR